MKKFIAIILCLAMVLTPTLAVDFKDISNSKNQEAIESLYNLGIVEGYNNFYFEQTANLTRAEACAIIARALVKEEEIYKNHYDVFNDVSYTSWYRSYIDTAYRNGYMHGYGDTFGPKDEITYAQFATILTNILGYRDLTLLDKWPIMNLKIADHLNLFKNIYYFDVNSFITREDAAQMIYNSLEQPIVEIKNLKVVNTDKKLIDLIQSDYSYSIEGVIHYLETKNDITTFWLYDEKEWIKISIKDLKTPLHNNDIVKLTYNYKNEITNIEVVDCIKYPYVVEGIVTEHFRDENEKLTLILIDNIPFITNINYTAINIEETSFINGVGIRAYVDENDEIYYFEFYTVKE